jgi:glycerophosphoryl diester phosphodiesterase
VKNLDFLKKSLIAHRGVHYNYIENTLSAFRMAMLKKYIIELDIHLTKDNKVVVFHDDNIKRITGVNKEIKESTYEELNNIMNIPTLDEVLNLVNGEVPIIIEFKSSQKVGKLEKEACKLLDNYKGDFAVQSFNPLSILWFKLNRNNYVRGFLVSSISKNSILINFYLNTLICFLSPDYIAINLKYLKSREIKKLRNIYLIIGYTVNSKEKYNKYKEAADNLICDIEKEPYE